MVPENEDSNKDVISGGTDDFMKNLFATAAKQRKMEKSAFKSDIQHEVDEYLSLPLSSSNEDPLAYWQKQMDCGKFSNLWKCARNVLAIQGTNVASERTNSCCAGVMTDLRVSLKFKQLNS